ncbi:MAG: hypothetical protein GY898_18545 [Proteobacteria bacterium]|nr:hypothetical protein [Pseudomonadota bacterium]
MVENARRVSSQTHTAAEPDTLTPPIRPSTVTSRDACPPAEIVPSSLTSESSTWPSVQPST